MSEIETKASFEVSSTEDALNFLDQLSGRTISSYASLEPLRLHMGDPKVEEYLMGLINLHPDEATKIAIIEFLISLRVITFRKGFNDILCTMILSQANDALKAVCLEALEKAEYSNRIRLTVAKLLEDPNELISFAAVRTYLYQVKNDPTNVKMIARDVASLDQKNLLQLIEKCAEENSELLSVSLVVTSYLNSDAFYFLAIAQMKSPFIERQLTALRLLGQSQSPRALSFIQSVVNMPGRPSEIYVLATTFLGDEALKYAQ